MSLMGVGAGAVAFHASSGPNRSWGRKLDYWVRLHARDRALIQTHWNPLNMADVTASGVLYHSSAKPVEAQWCSHAWTCDRHVLRAGAHMHQMSCHL